MVYFSKYLTPRFFRCRGAQGFYHDSLFPDESLDIRTESIGRLAKRELEVVRQEGNVISHHC